MEKTSISLVIRDFQEDDAAALLEIYRAAIHVTASAFYAPEQCSAWAPRDIDPMAWSHRIMRLQPMVACDAKGPVGYADLQADGYIDHFFVHPRAGGRGVGRALMSALLGAAQSRGIARLYADVSVAAEQFFSQHGFVMENRSANVIRGISVPNVRMTKILGPTADDSLDGVAPHDPCAEQRDSSVLVENVPRRSDPAGPAASTVSCGYGKQ